YPAGANRFHVVGYAPGAAFGPGIKRQSPDRGQSPRNYGRRTAGQSHCLTSDGKAELLRARDFRRKAYRPFFLILIGFVLACVSLAQDSRTPSNSRGVIRLRVRVKVGDSTKGLSRKRFFLIKGSADQNKSFIDTVEHQAPLTRDCFYRQAGASE